MTVLPDRSYSMNDLREESVDTLRGLHRTLVHEMMNDDFSFPGVTNERVSYCDPFNLGEDVTCFKVGAFRNIDAILRDMNPQARIMPFMDCKEYNIFWLSQRNHSELYGAQNSVACYGFRKIDFFPETNTVRGMVSNGTGEHPLVVRCDEDVNWLTRAGDYANHLADYFGASDRGFFCLVDMAMMGRLRRDYPHRAEIHFRNETAIVVFGYRRIGEDFLEDMTRAVQHVGS